MKKEPLIIERFVIRCSVSFVSCHKLAYITDSGFSTNLEDAKLYKAENNAKAAVRYFKKNNTYVHNYKILRVKGTLELCSINSIS